MSYPNLPLLQLHRLLQVFVIATLTITTSPNKLTAESVVPAAMKAEAISRSQEIGFDWKFFEGDPVGAHEPTFDSTAWQTVQVPHDWSIYNPKQQNAPGGSEVGYFPAGIGWYRKNLDIPSHHAGKKVFVRFDGVFEDSEIWINGHSLGRRPYGYTTFEHDLTPHLNFGGANILAVRVDNSKQPNSRWYTGSGIYRQVHLTTTDKLHVPMWGTRVTTPDITNERGLLVVETVVANDHAQAAQCTVVTRVTDPTGAIVAEAAVAQNIQANTRSASTEQLQIPAPMLWSVQTPHLYRVETIIKMHGETRDIYTTTFGFRTVRFDQQQGFVLNGRPIELKGVNLHHDAGSLGAAVPVRALERRLQILKELGCNAIRTSHNPAAPELLELCDRMGFVVIAEAFDKWSAPHGRWFPDWGRRDLTDMIRRDRNHPSIIMWSVGNELPNQGSDTFMKQLDELVSWTRGTDNTRPVTVALRPVAITSRAENARQMVNIAKRVDIISLNYQEQWFDDYRELWPEILMVASESYPFFRGDGDSYKAFLPLNSWMDAERNGYVLGTFYWAGIDYLGEAVAGWPCHGWNGSLIDTCGFVRPVGELIRSFWTDRPMVHLAVMDELVEDIQATKDHWGWPNMASHWTHPQLEGREVKVAAFTNCAAVELFLNDRSLGTKQLADFPDRIMYWPVPYVPGRLEARAICDGKVVASHRLETAGAPARIELSADRTHIHADGQDLSHVEVSIVDHNGRVVPTAKHNLRFQIEGPAKIVGVDNGDLFSMESYKGNSRSASYGRALIIIQSQRDKGPVTLRASAADLTPATLEIEVQSKELKN